jgi:hypothetical protein
MRDDMHKVVTERRRVGGDSGKRKMFEQMTRVRDRRSYRGVEEDFSPKKESMRRPHIINYGGKEFSDLIGPLHRYLQAQNGRPWNDVWSDICKVLKGNGLQANHIKDHVRQYVGGIPHSGKTFFHPDDWYQARGRWGVGVYVDKNGILQRYQGKKR